MANTKQGNEIRGAIVVPARHSLEEGNPDKLLLHVRSSKDTQALIIPSKDGIQFGDAT